VRVGIEASSVVNEHPTGLEHSITQLLARLSAAGGAHQYALHFNFVRPACARHFEARIRPLLSERFEARICRMPARAVRSLRRWWPIEWTLGDCDVVHYPQPPLRAQRRGARVLTVHDLIPLTHAHCCQPSLVARCRRELPGAVQQADAIIAVSHHTKGELVERLGVAPERIRVVHHGVDPSFRPVAPSEVAALRERLQLRRRYLFGLGTGDPRKNAVGLVEAFARCRARGLDDVELVLAGKPWVATARVRERVAELGLQGAVRVLEYVPAADLPALYTGAAAFVFPSLAEGFGMPVLEAMACGTPVIAAGVTALPEVVGSAGLLVDPTDVHELAAAIAEVLGDSALRGALAARGRARAAGFSWERAARETVAVYEAAA
jgi:glycosyltransferase involved in cell wall biosynthesis